jgi:SAM-dependent methyltransferase
VVDRSTSDHGEPAHIVNFEQASAWDGDDGDDWTDHEEQYNATSRPHTRRLFDAARITPSDRILDIGCGCGETTRMAARIAPEGQVLGVDLSSRMLERARERSRDEGLTNVSFERADVQVYPFEEGTLDLAISRFGVMFFGDPIAAFQNVRSALKPGGRVAFLAWQPLARNEWMSELFGALAAGRDLPRPPAGAPGPFGLADPDATRQIFSAAGFEGAQLDDVTEPVTVGANVDDAFSFVRSLGVTRGLLRDLDPETTARALDAVRATIAAHDTGAGIRLGSAAWLITAHRS